VRPALDLTSVPRWATEVTCPPVDLSGRQWAIIAVCAAAMQVTQRWRDEISRSIAGSDVVVHEILDGGTGDLAGEALHAELADARVGRRLMIAGPADCCLSLRAAAVAAGVADGEMSIASTGIARRAVLCAQRRCALPRFASTRHSPAAVPAPARPRRVHRHRAGTRQARADPREANFFVGWFLCNAMPSGSSSEMTPPSP
jgi:hypothetical protein